MSLTRDNTLNVSERAHGSERGDGVHVFPSVPCFCVSPVTRLVLMLTPPFVSKITPKVSDGS